MAASYNNWEQFYHKYNLIFNGLVALPLLPFAFLFLETQKEFPEAPLLEGTSSWVLMGVATAIGGVAVFLSYRWKGEMPAIFKDYDSVREKLDAYISFKLKQFLILEVPAVCAMIGLYLTKEQFFTVLYIAVLAIYSLSRPTFDGVVRELGVSAKELMAWGDKTDEKK